ELTGAATLTTSFLDVGAGVTLVKSGTGKLIAFNESIGVGGTFEVQAGEAVLTVNELANRNVGFAGTLSVVNAGSILRIDGESSAPIEVEAINIGDGGIFILDSVPLFAPEGGLALDAGSGAGDAPAGADAIAGSVQGVPEPGTAALLFGGMLTMLGL